MAADAVRVVDPPPTIDTLWANHDTVLQGAAIRLTAEGVSDTDGTVSSVAFYRDADQDGEADPEELLDTDTTDGDGWWTSVDTTSLGVGEHTFLAVATDNDGLHSDPASTTANVAESVPGLAAWYPFTSDATDAAGTNDGTLQGDASIAADTDRGQVLQLDGSGDYVSLGDPAGLNVTGTITLAAWIKPEATDGIRNIVVRGHQSYPKGEVFLRIADGKYEVGSWNGSPHKTSAAMPAGDLGQWVHLTGVYDGTSWRLYRNGVEIASQQESTGAVAVATGWAIGARATGTERFFQGRIDDARIYDDGLSASEVFDLGYENYAPTLDDALLLFSDTAIDDEVIAVLAASDHNTNETFSYEITSGNEQGFFAIDNGGAITVANSAALHADGGQQYTLGVMVTDDGSPALSDTATVTLRRDTVPGGLVGHWRLDDASGATAQDWTGRSDGTYQGDVSTLTGPVDAAATFDGNDDYVELGNPDHLSITGQITLAAWIKPTATDGFRNIIVRGHHLDPKGEIFLRINAGQYEIGSWNGTTYCAFAAIPAVDVGHWTHLAGVYDGTHWRLYRNGVEIAAQEASTGAVPVATGWAIGSRATGTERFFQGAIDDARIYNRGLAWEEVDQLATTYQNMAPTLDDAAMAVLANPDLGESVGQVIAHDPITRESFGYAITAGDPSGIFAIGADGTISVADPVALKLDGTDVWQLAVAATDNGPSPLDDTATVTVYRDAAPDGRIGHWRLDEASGATTAADEAGNNDGTLHGDAAMVTDAVRNQVLQLDGAGDYLALGNPAELNFTGQITLAAWIRPEATDGIRNIVVHGYSPSPKGEVYLRIAAGRYEIGSWDGTGHKAGYDVPAGDIGNWVHLTGVYDGTAWRLYRNGVEVASQQESTGAVTVAEDWAIGARGTGTERFFNGRIDDARIYTRGLSAEEADALAGGNLNQPPVVDDASMAIVGDATLGVYVGAVSASDPEGTALTYVITGGSGAAVFAIDPATGVITVADPAALDFTAHGPYTLTVTAIDDGVLPQYASGTITVTEDTSTKGLLGHWRFDEASGASTATDSAGDNDGTLQGDAAIVTDPGRGQSLQLDGNGDYVALGNPPELEITGPITLAAWINPTATDGFRNIIVRGHHLDPKGEIFLRINSGQYQIGSWNGTNHYTSAAIPSGDLGQWVHLAGVYDGTHWRLYRNGVEIASQQESTGAVPVETGWAIGSRATGTERFFQGTIDDARIYDRGLTEVEVDDLAGEPALPRILGIDAPSVVSQGDPIELTVLTDESEISSFDAVGLYRDADGDGTLGDDELASPLVMDDNQADGRAYTIATDALAVGPHTFFVLAYRSGQVVDQAETIVYVSEKEIENPDEENCWTFDLEEGLYEVFVTWTASEDNSPLAVYRVTQSGGLLLASGVDQTAAPADDAFNGVTWDKLGEVEIATGQVEVELIAGQEGELSADAVCFQPIDTRKLPRIGGDPYAFAGQPYSLQLDSGDYGELAWIIEWGDVTQTYSGGDMTVTHTYTSPGTLAINVEAVGETGPIFFEPCWIPLDVIPTGNLIRNGDFSQPVITNSYGWDLFNCDGFAECPEWSGRIELQGGGGDQHAELDSDENGPGEGYYPGETGQTTISQGFSSTPGWLYTLSYTAWERGGTAPEENRLHVEVGGVDPAVDFIDYLCGTADPGYDPDAGSLPSIVTATDSSITVMFSDVGEYDNTLGTFLDNVEAYGLAPAIDIDTDSNNDGVPDLLDDPIEEDGPGKILKPNEWASLDVFAQIDEHFSGAGVVIELEYTETAKYDLKDSNPVIQLNPESLSFGGGTTLDTTITATGKAQGAATITLKIIVGTTTVAQDTICLSVADPILSIEVSDNYAHEEYDEADFTITRTGYAALPLEVNFSTAGSAELGTDYVLSAAKSIHLPADDAEVLVSVHPLDDGLYEDKFEATALILDAGDWYTVGESWTATATLEDGERRLPKLETAYTTLECGGCIPDWEVIEGSFFANWNCLVYQSFPDPVIRVDTILPTDRETSAQSSISATFYELDKNGKRAGEIGTPAEATFQNGNNDGPGDELLFVVPGDLATKPTGRYDWDMTVVTDYPADETSTRTFEGNEFYVNRNDSPYGNGWFIGNAANIYPTSDGVTLLTGGGTPYSFTDDGTGTLTPENGSFAQTTIQQQAGGGYLLTEKDGTTIQFDENGLIQEVHRPGGSSSVYHYIDADGDGEADEIGSIENPATGEVVTYHFANDGPGTRTLLAYIDKKFGHDGTTYVMAIFEHDDDGNLTRILEPFENSPQGTEGYETVFGYEPDSSRMTAYTYDSSQTISTGLDFAGMVSQVTEPDPADSPFSDYTLAEDESGETTDANGTTESYTTDLFGNVTSYTQTIDARPISTTYERNDDGQLTRLVEPDPDGTGPLAAAETLFSYDDRGNRSGVVHPDGTTESWTYEPAFNRVTSHTDELDRLVLYEIEPSTGLTLSVTRVVGEEDSPTNGETDDVTSSYTYTDGTDDPSTTGVDESTWPLGLTLTNTDPLGRVTRYEYNNRGLTTKVISAAGTALEACVQYEYNDKNKQTAYVDELGRRTEYVYDIRGRVIRITSPDPDGEGPLAAPVSETVYDADGNVWKEIDPLGNATEYQYDALGRLIHTISADPDGEGPLPSLVTESVYDAAGQLLQSIDPAGNVTEYQYDTLGRQVRTVLPDPDGAGPLESPVSESVYNDAGQLIQSIDALGNVAAYEYDLQGRLVKTIAPDPDGTGPLESPVFQSVYSDAGQLVQSIDALGNVTQYEYDGLGRQVKTILPDPDGTGPLAAPEMQSVYDKAGQLVQSIDALGNVTQYEYDARGRQTKVTLPDPDGTGPLASPETQYAYDAAGQLTTATDALGRVTTYQYDNLGRQTKVIQPDPDGAGPLAAPETTAAYNAAGQVTSTTDPLGNVTTYQYDNLGRQTKVILPDPDGAGPLAAPETQYVYRAAGQLAGVIDPLGRVTTSQYDALGRQTHTIDAMGNVSETVYNVASRVAQQIAPAPTLTRGLLGFWSFLEDTGTTAADLSGGGHAGTLSGGPTRVDGQLGSALAFDGTDDYVALGNPAELDVTGAVTLSAWIRPEATDGIRNILVHGHSPSPAGEVYLRIAAGRYEIGSWDGTGHKAGYDVPAGDIGNWVHLTGVYDGTAWRLYRNGVEVASQQESTGAVSVAENWAIGARGTGTERFFQGTIDEVRLYDRALAQDEIDVLAGTATGPVTEFVYDNLGRQTNIIQPDPDGTGPLASPETAYVYNAAGQLTSLSDPLGRTTAYEYDDLGRQTKTIMPDPDGSGPLTPAEHSTTYDALGRPLTETDPLANTTSYAYDNLGRLVSQTDAEQGVTGFTYDLVGNRLSLTDPEDNATEWVYDALNRVVEETNALDDTRYFEYNTAGYLTRRVDRRGWVRQFQYDNLGQNTAEIWYDSAADADADQNRQNTLTFTFDAAGQILTAGDASAQYGHTYDALGRAALIEHQIAGLTPMVSFAQQFDAAGRRTRLAATVGSTADFLTDYVYDRLGRIDTIKQQGQGGAAVAPKYVDFAFDAAGQPDWLKRYADPGGTQLVAETAWAFDGAGRLTDLTHAKGAATLADYDWQFDAAGRMTRFVSSNDGTVDYTNDATGQLTGADYDYQSDENYVYDENGNRVNNGYTTGTNNQMTSDGTYTYLYDAEGNRTAKFVDNDTDGQIGAGDTDITQYAWDHRNRLVKVEHFATHTAYNATDPDKVVEYAYDLGNRWIRKVLDTNGDGTADSSAIFVYDNNQITLQFDHTGTGAAATSDLTHRYLWGTAVDQILADETADDGGAEDVLWPLTDHLNTVRDLASYDPNTDTTTIANHLTYDAFGNVTSETAPTVNTLFQFTARPFDPETGLQNNLNRWYDLSTGRWMSEDSLAFSGGDTNLNRYAHNRATYSVDPTGLKRVDVDVWSATGTFRPARPPKGDWKTFKYEGIKGLLAKATDVFQVPDTKVAFLQPLITSVETTFKILSSTVEKLKTLLSPVQEDVLVEGKFRRGQIDANRFRGWYDENEKRREVVIGAENCSLTAYEFSMSGRLAYHYVQTFAIEAGTFPLKLRLGVSAKVANFSASGIYVPEASPRFVDLSVSGKGHFSAAAALGTERGIQNQFYMAAWSYAAFSAAFAIGHELPFPYVKEYLTLQFTEPLLAFGLHAEVQVLKWKKDIDKVLIKPIEDTSFRIPMQISLPGV